MHLRWRNKKALLFHLQVSPWHFVHKLSIQIQSQILKRIKLLCLAHQFWFKKWKIQDNPNCNGTGDVCLFNEFSSKILHARRLPVSTIYRVLYYIGCKFNSNHHNWTCGNIYLTVLHQISMIKGKEQAVNDLVMQLFVWKISYGRGSVAAT